MIDRHTPRNSSLRLVNRPRRAVHAKWRYLLRPPPPLPPLPLPPLPPLLPEPPEPPLPLLDPLEPLPLPELSEEPELPEPESELSVDLPPSSEPER